MLFSCPVLHLQAFTQHNPKETKNKDAAQVYASMLNAALDLTPSALTADNPELTSSFKKETLAFQSALNVFETTLVGDKPPEDILLLAWAAIDARWTHLAAAPEIDDLFTPSIQKLKAKVIEKLFSTPTCVTQSFLTSNPLFAPSALLTQQTTSLALKVLRATTTTDHVSNLFHAPPAAYDTDVLSSVLSEHYEIGAKHMHSSANLQLSPERTQHPKTQGYFIASAFDFPPQLTASAGGGVARSFSYLIAMFTAPLCTPSGTRLLKDIFSQPHLFDINSNDAQLLIEINSEASAKRQSALRATSSSDITPLKLLKLFAPGSEPVADESFNAIALPSNTTLSLMNALAQRVHAINQARYLHSQEHPSESPLPFAPISYVPIVGSNPQNVSSFYQNEFGSRGVPRLPAHVSVDPMASSRHRSFFFADKVFAQLPLQAVKLTSEHELDHKLTSASRHAALQARATVLSRALLQDLVAFKNKFRFENHAKLQDKAESALQLIALNQLDTVLASDTLTHKLSLDIKARLRHYYESPSSDLVDATLLRVFHHLHRFA